MTIRSILVGWLLGGIAGCAPKPEVTHTGCVGVGEVIAASCMPCHSASTRSGSFDFETDWYTTWMESGLVTPGDAANSSVYLRMTDPARPMPPSAQISSAYLAIVSDWIDAGAVCPDGDTGAGTP